MPLKPAEIALTGNEAIVLFEWLAKTLDDEPPPNCDLAETGVLLQIQAQLERSQTVIFEDDYREQLAAAKAEIARGGR